MKGIAFGIAIGKDSTGLTSVPTLAQVLVAGNTTGGTDISVSDGDDILMFSNPLGAGTASKLQWNATNFIQFDESGTGALTVNAEDEIQLLANSGAVTYAGDTLAIDSQTVTRPSIGFNSSAVNSGSLAYSALTGNRTWTLPDNTGTIALTSDIPASTNIYTDSGTLDDNSRVITLAGSTSGQLLQVNTGAGAAIIQFNGSRQILIPSATEHKISGTGTHNVTLGGNLSTDLYKFQNNSGNDIVDFRGDRNIYVYNEMGFATNPNGQQRLHVLGSSFLQGIRVSGTPTSYGMALNCNAGSANLFVQNGTTGGKGIYILDVKTSGNNISLDIENRGASTGNNIGIELDVRNGANNYAINILNGDINTTGGIGLSNTYTFGGGGSGDIASMTFTKGILTGVTTVP